VISEATDHPLGRRLLLVVVGRGEHASSISAGQPRGRAVSSRDAVMGQTRDTGGEAVTKIFRGQAPRARRGCVDALTDVVIDDIPKGSAPRCGVASSRRLRDLRRADKRHIPGRQRLQRSGCRRAEG
jgi:hypothetical protein